MSHICEGYHHLLSEIPCIMATWHGATDDRSNSEPVLTNHAQAAGPCTGCLKVHDKDRSHQPLVQAPVPLGLNYCVSLHLVSLPLPFPHFQTIRVIILRGKSDVTCLL